MKTKKLPFNISLLDPTRDRLMGLLPVTSLDIYGTDGDFHPDGLYSNIIFGKPNDPMRMRRDGYIDLRTEILHPKLFNELIRLKGFYSGIMGGTIYAVWNSKIKDFERSDVLDGRTGYSFFMEHLAKIDFQRNDSSIRDLRIDLIKKFLKRGMVRYVMVLPAGLRDITVDDTGRTTEDEINDYYRSMLRASNVVSTSIGAADISNLDGIRWTLQQSFNNVFKHIETILSGKRGFLLAKWGGRNIHNGSRNIITAMDPAPIKLNSPSSFSMTDTMIGIYQFMASVPDITIHNLKTSLIGEFINQLPKQVAVVDTKTLKSVTIEPSQDTVTAWGSNDGLYKLISNFAKAKHRHDSIIVDGHFVKLIYRDDKSWRLLDDISELPAELDPQNVKGITWVELFYIISLDSSKQLHGLVTRYPITGDGSIYPSKIFLRSTSVSESLVELDSDWGSSSRVYPMMPVLNKPFIDSMSVNPKYLKALGGDYDGDKCSFNILTSQEANQEIETYLKSEVQFLSPSGKLRYGVTGDIENLVLHNFTRGLIDE